MALPQLPRTRAGRQPAAHGPAPLPRWRPNNRPALSSTTPGRWGGGGRKAAGPPQRGRARPRLPAPREKEEEEEQERVPAALAAPPRLAGRSGARRRRVGQTAPAAPAASAGSGPAPPPPPRLPSKGEGSRAGALPGRRRPTNRRADGWPRWARIGSLRPRWAGRAGAAGAATSTGLRFSNADGAGAAVGGRAGRCGDRWPVRDFLGVRRREVRVPELGSQLPASAAADEGGRTDGSGGALGGRWKRVPLPPPGVGSRRCASPRLGER